MTYVSYEEAVKKLMLTHPGTGKLVTAEELIAILKEDMVLSVEDSNSWKGSNMLTVFQYHGFFNDPPDFEGG